MRIVSYSLWGEDPKYYVGAVRNMVQHMNGAYRDWVFRFYCDSLVPKAIVNTLRAFGAEVVVVDVVGDWKFAVQRFLAIDDPNVDCCIFRDCDSRFSTREIAAVEEWIYSNKKLHVMRDHPYHGNFPILAGMWGIKNQP